MLTEGYLYTVQVLTKGCLDIVQVITQGFIQDVCEMLQRPVHAN
jgi:hypothetical protein